MNLNKKKSFRIEKFKINSSSDARAIDEDIDTYRHRELMNAIAALKTEVHEHEIVDDNVREEYENKIDKYKIEAEEARKLRSELEKIYIAIDETKREIATLHGSTIAESEEGVGVGYELDAVVGHTENATESILSSAEHIDTQAANLAASLEGSLNEMASDIQDQVINIFEACNFQDITGQRINKVVSALKFVETRVGHMIEIWGGLEGFKKVEVIEQEKSEHEKLLNGPGRDDDPDKASQSDIDELFS